MGGRGSTGGGGRAGGLEGQIRAAYQAIVKERGEAFSGFVGLADIRDKIPGDLARADVDATLRTMERKEDVRIIPVANTKALKPWDHHAALMIGGEANHAIQITKGRRR